MIRTCVLAALFAATALVAGLAAAVDLSKLSDDERRQLNDWMAKRAELMTNAGKLEREVAGAWTNDAYTSAEVAGLRKRYRELQEELSQTQHAIQAKVLEMPALQAKTNALAVAQAGVNDLNRKIFEKTGE